MSEPCQFCGKPLEHALACPHLESFDPNPQLDGALNKAVFSRPVCRVYGNMLIRLPHTNAEAY